MDKWIILRNDNFLAAKAAARSGLVLLALVVAGGCGGRNLRSDADDAEKARIISAAENRVAVAKVGVQVCRSYPVGVSEQNRVRGKVSAVEGEAIIVVVEDPGSIAMDVGSQRLAKGILLKDSSRNWVPCL